MPVETLAAEVVSPALDGNKENNEDDDDDEGFASVHESDRENEGDLKPVSPVVVGEIQSF